MKKTLKYIMLALMICSCLALSGCSNIWQKKYQPSTGVTMLVYSEGEDYYAQIIITTTRLVGTVGLGSNGVGYVDGVIENVDEYLFSVLSTQFSTTRRNSHAPSAVQLGDSLLGAQFTYFCKISEDAWFLGDEDGINIDYRFLTAKVSCDFDNPFADAYKQGTAFGNIYDILLNGRDGLGQLSEYISIDNLNGVQTKLLIGARSSTRAKTGEVVILGENSYYQLESALAETVTTANSRISYSYKAMVSYGWFALAILIGAAVVGLILLLAKKKEGRRVDLSNHGHFASGQNDFGPYGGQATPFEGFGAPGSNPFGGDGQNSDQNGGGNNGGSPFDGF